MRRRIPYFKIVFGLVLLAVIAVVGLHFHVQRQVERQLIAVASQVSPVASFEWGRILLHPAGQIRIHDLRLVPHLVAGEIRIQQVAFTAPDIIDLLLAAREFEQGKLPESLGLSIRALQIPIEASGMHRLEAPFHTGLPFEFAGCAPRDWVMFSDLPHMDLWNLVTDINLDYRITGNGQGLELRLGTHTQYVAGLTADARLHLGSGSRDVDLVARAWNMARLERMELAYRNLGFRERLNRYCAERLDMPVDEFIDRHLAAWTMAWARYGLEPSPEVVSHYRDFVADPQVMELRIRPEERLPLTALTRLERGELLERLGLSVAVNHAQAASVQFASVPVVAAVPEFNEHGGETAPRETDSAAPRRPSWTEISVGQAHRHVNQRVRITTTTGDRFSGELVDTDAEHLHLRMRGTGGFLVRPFARNRLSTLEVRE